MHTFPSMLQIFINKSPFNGTVAFIFLPSALQHSFPQNGSAQSPPARVKFQFFGIPMLFKVNRVQWIGQRPKRGNMRFHANVCLKHQCFIYTKALCSEKQTCTCVASLLSGEPKGAEPQHLCGVSQRDQRQRPGQRPGPRRQGHAPPSRSQYSRIHS